METLHNCTLILFVYLLFTFTLTLHVLVRAQLLPIVHDNGPISDGRTQTYIVHVEKPDQTQLLGHQHSELNLEKWHISFLPNPTLDSGEPRLLYSYRHAISGFAARLTPDEVKAMESKPGFVHAEPDRTRRLATTYTPEFLGLHRQGTRAARPFSADASGQGIIIGVIDTGILPTHPSFNDAGMPPPPAKWKGKCGFPSFSCNNKIIGGAAFRSRDRSKKQSPVDDQGHGTHVAGTAAGSFVSGAEVLGTANGTASGIAPKAHISVYKVCYTNGCDDSDILAAIDQAISDGVDVITMSLGGNTDDKFYIDSVALGSLAAASRGIIASTAAGNNGPDAETLSHSAPWLLTVAASSTDRRIAAVVKLGNGKEYLGETAYQPPTFNSSVKLPLIYPSGAEGAEYCLSGSLKRAAVKGKAVVCSVGRIGSVEKGKIVAAAGGAAMILTNVERQGFTTFSEAHVLPVSNVGFADGEKIRSYVTSTSSPTATIAFMGTQFGYRPSPGLAYFSSRGPSTANGGILKPDVMAPGVNILAAWPFKVGPNPVGPPSIFNFLSGTSMATPHVAGVIALVKGVHTDWSPAAVVSAIVTTARGLDLDGNVIVDESSGGEADIYYTGGGIVDPTAALDPGLVYDVKPDEYVGYLCGLGYSDKEVQATVGRRVKCSSVGSIQASQLNYPSISVYLGPASTTVSINRTVTTVGEAEVYRARITAPAGGVEVAVSPELIRFGRGKREASFTVRIAVTDTGITTQTSFRGKLEWVSDARVVTSPIAVLYSA